jgi:mono/diheme cytochrome c family protein
MGMSAHRLLVVACVALVACQPTEAHERASAALASRASSEHVPARFGFGRAPTADEIRRVDIDVGPDGAGLPPGSGTVAQGATLYAAKCAGCHGPAAEGTAVAAALVGRNPGDAFDFAASRDKERTKTVGNYWPYATTLYDYIHRAMPFDKPGTLAPDEVYSLVAFVLARNGIVKDDAVIDARTLPAVRMPARDRFVPDDRERSTRVR